MPFYGRPKGSFAQPEAKQDATKQSQDREIGERPMPGWVHGLRLIQLARQRSRSARLFPCDPVLFVSRDVVLYKSSQNPIIAIRGQLFPPRGIVFIPEAFDFGLNGDDYLDASQRQQFPEVRYKFHIPVPIK